MSVLSAATTSYSKGVLAEKAAIKYLRLAGYEILHERYKAPVGEIDILALKEGLLVAIEVKARGSIGEALHAITPRNRQRVEKALLHFLALNENYAAYGMRFDVIAICGALELQHLDNAWEASS